MNRRLTLCFCALLNALFIAHSPVNSQTLEQVWKKDFSKPVSWYVRTSPGILLIRTGQSLTAVDGVSGRQLWALPDVKFGILSGTSEEFDRGKNILEVPLMGVLLLNRVVLPGDSNGHLIALNLMTGERLWTQAQADGLMTAVPLYDTSQIVLVSRRLQRKILAAEVAASAATRVPILLYPFRLEFQRLDLLTGKVQWSAEYPHTFVPGSQSVAALGAYLFVYYSNRMLGCVDLKNGNLLWENGSKVLGTESLPLPLQMANGRLIYGSTSVRAVDPATGQLGWEIDNLGKITGILLREGLVVAIGEKNVAGVDANTGTELWRKKTHGHTTNLLWDKTSDAIVYVDGRGLHSVERTTGKSLLDARLAHEKLQSTNQPYHIRLATADMLVAIATDELSAYNFKNGRRLFTARKPTAFFPSVAFLDHWPTPVDGEGLRSMIPAPSGHAEWENVRKGSLLSSDTLNRLEEYLSATDGTTDSYETELAAGVRKVWWIDPQTNTQVEIGVSGDHHDVSRALGMVFAVDGNQLWAAKIVPN